MRISTALLAQQGLNSILEQQAKLSRTQLQLSSGERILTPADDPTGAARIVDLSQQIESTEQFQRNSDVAENRLQVEEGALNGVNNLLQRVRELTVQANNDSVSPSDRESLAAEIEIRLDELLALANSRDANGEFLFAGYQTQTQPFSQTVAGFPYSGDQGQRFLQIGPNTQIAVGDPGSEVFQLISEGNGTFTVQDATGNTGSGVIDPGSVTDPGAWDGDSYTIRFPVDTGIDAAAMGAFAHDPANNQNLTYDLSVNGTLVYSDTDGDATPPISTVAEMVTQINTQTGTHGVRAYEVNGNLHLVNVPASTADIVVTEAVTDPTPGDGDSVSTFFGQTLTDPGGGGSASVTYTTTDASAYVVEDAAGNLETSGAYLDGGQIAFNGIQTNIKGTPQSGDTFSIAPAATQDVFTTLRNLINALEGGSGSTTAFHNDINRVLTNLDQAMDNMLDTRAKIGARLNSIDSQRDVNESFLLQLRSVRSTLEDLDYAEAASRLNLELVGLQAAQQTFVRLQGLSLFNFL